MFPKQQQTDPVVHHRDSQSFRVHPPGQRASSPVIRQEPITKRDNSQSSPDSMVSRLAHGGRVSQYGVDSPQSKFLRSFLLKIPGSSLCCPPSLCPSSSTTANTLQHQGFLFSKSFQRFNASKLSLFQRFQRFNTSKLSLFQSFHSFPSFQAFYHHLLQTPFSIKAVSFPKLSQLSKLPGFLSHHSSTANTLRHQGFLFSNSSKAFKASRS